MLCRFLVFLLACFPLLSQTVTGSLEGHVNDVSGSVLVGARLTATNIETGLKRESVSNDKGYFQLSFLPIGAYQLKAEAPGFGGVQRNAQVDSSTTKALDFALKPATVQTEITVEAEATLVETSRGEQRGSVGEKEIADRPLSSRNMLALLEMMPGFQSSGGFSGVNNPTLSSGSYASFNGTGSRSASFQVDGVNNDDSSEGTSRQNVNVSSIKEFAVLTNAFSAEFGRGGTVILVQSKSGTNRIHGDLYELFQNQVLNSNGFFNNTAGSKPDGTPVVPRAPYRRNQFGGTIGGPILKNKLFLFHSSEKTYLQQYNTFTRYIFLPEDKIQIGDCRLCLNPNEHPNLQADKKVLDDIIARFPKVKPNNLAFCDHCLTATRPATYPDEDFSGRVDYNVSVKDIFAVRYQYSRQHRRPDSLIQGESAFQNNKQQSMGLTHTHIFSPSTSGEFRFGLGLRTTLVDISDGNGTPIVRISNPSAYTTTTMGSAGGFPINRWQTDKQFNYNLTHVRGKHVLKVGLDFRRQHLDDIADNNSRGFYNFTSSGIRGAANFYEGYENFLRGFVASYQKGFGNFYTQNRSGEFNQYVMDDWKLTPTFTLNIGYRHEVVLKPTEVNNKISYGYETFTKGYEPRFGFAWSPRKISPALRWLIGGPEKVSLRGGFGLFHSRIPQSVFSQSGASLRSQHPYGILQTFGPTFEIGDSTNGYVYDPNRPLPRISLARISPDLKMPSIQHYNLTLDRQIGRDLLLSVGYTRTRGIGLIQNANSNRSRFPFTDPVTGILYDKIDSNLGNTAPAPGFISLAQPRYNERRPDPRYALLTVFSNGSWSYYNALRVQVRKRYSKGFHWMLAYSLAKSIDTGSDFSQGVTLSELDSARSLRGLSDFDQRHRANINYGYDLPWFRKDRGWKGYTVGGWSISGNHTYASGNPFTVTAGYDVNADGVTNDRPILLNNALYGLSLDNGRINPATGRQFSEDAFPVDAFYPTVRTPQTQRPFDPGGTGKDSIGRNTFYGSGIKNWDLGLSKSFPALRENHSLRLRAEMYNVTNSPRFAFPTRSAQSLAFGRIVSTYNPLNFVGASRADDTSRVVQLTLRYVY